MSAYNCCRDIIVELKDVIRGDNELNLLEII